MKKKSRFLTGLLSAVMALSLCALPAAAADDAKPEATTANPVAIDKNATGSIEIHKYIEDSTDWSKLPNGTGEKDENAVAGKTPLANVTFTAYKVMDENSLVAYYDGLNKGNVKEVTIADYKETDGTFNKEKSVEKDKDGNPIGHPATTNLQGTGKISGLQVGLYAVFETAHPDGVTQVTPAFLVSIPMTQRSTDSNWMYDVVVYPKNKTTAAGITLKKQGKTGNNVDAALEGYKFKLEKYNKTSQKWAVISGESKNGQDTIGNGSEVFTTSNSGEIGIESLTPGIYRFTEVEGPANSAYIIDKDSHYYFEVTTSGTIVAVAQLPAEDNNAVTNAVDASGNTITVINHKPDLEKQVQNGETFKEAADYSAGDMVPYQITIKVPENIAKLKTFTVTDTPNGLNDDTATIKVVGKTSSADADVVLAENGVIDAINGKAITKIQPDSSTKGFTIEFAPANLAEYAGQELVITYKAKLLGKEKNNAAVANLNNAKLTYSNVIDTTSTGTPSEKTIEDETVVYSFKLTIDKQGEKTNTKLKNVEFDLYKEVDNGDSDTISAADAKAFGLNETKCWKKVNQNKIVTNGDGAATLTGLAKGTYYLVETKTAEGYNLLSKPVEVTLDKDYVAEWTEKTEYDENGVKHHTYEKDATKFDGDEGTSSSVQSVTVINRMGFKLPTTGGFGTLLFSGIGALLVVGGVGVLMSTKKKKGNG